MARPSSEVIDDEREARAARANAALARARAILEKPAPTVEPKKTSWGERPRAPHYEERLERFVQGDRRALDGWMEDEPVPVHTAAEHQILEDRERRRPTLDTATQSLWEAFIARQCEEIISAKFEAFIDIVGEETGRSERQFREELRSLRGPWREQMYGDLLKRFSKSFEVMRDDVLAVLRAELGIRGDNVVDLPNPIKRKV
jgi:hypothetical protein